MSADPRTITRLYGACRLHPTAEVVAGSVGTWTLTYTVGEYGYDDSGALKIAWRFATDWGAPQVSDPAALNYCSVATDGAGRVCLRCEPKGNVRPWQRCLTVDIADDGLRPGDTLTVVFGDTTGGSPGMRAQTFVEPTFEFRVLADPIATGRYTVLPDSPEVAVIAGPPARLVVIAPSQLAPGQAGMLLVKAEDAWGNPSPEFSGPITVNCPGLDFAPFSLPAEAEGLARIPFTAGPPGVYRFLASAAGLQAVSNPLLVAQEQGSRPFWADLHGQSEATVGTGTCADYFAFGRDRAGLDICCHQGNDFQIRIEDWKETIAEVQRHYEPGRYVTLLGYEWSGNTAAGGDHNVIYRSDDAPLFRSSRALVDDHSDLDTDRWPLPRLYEELHQHAALVIAHVGGRRADLDCHDPRVRRLVEVYSAWGEFEWMLTEALRRGQKVGVTANSDGHKGRPGASYPGASQFGVYGGLTCVLAPELTREAIFDALYQRACYATTGQRLLLSVQIAGLLMGEEGAHEGPVPIAVVVHGTDGIEAVDIFRDQEVIHRFDPRGAQRLSPQMLRVSWRGARILGRRRETIWDGHLELMGTEILAAEPYALDSPLETVQVLGPRRVAWKSLTTGDADGVILRLADATRGLLRFETAPCRFSLDLTRMSGPRHIVEAGGVGQQVEVRRLPDLPCPRDVQLSWADAAPPAGDHAYWVRVTQTDGARAWSSPVFLTCEPA